MNSSDVPLILASASPRRKEILEAHGYSPVVIPSDIDETLPADADLAPEQTTIYLAELKAEAVLAGLNASDWPEGCIVLGVDTIVYKDHIIGKPVDEADALAILRSLSGASHEVISGVCLIRANPSDRGLEPSVKELFSDTTTVRFGDYTDEEILAYIRANPPYDKSGSYAIQSDWGRHVLEMDGDIENVIGLPFIKLSSYLEGSFGSAQNDDRGDES